MNYFIYLTSINFSLTNDHATGRSNILHPKRNMGKRTFKYAWAIILFNSLPNYVKSARSVNSFKKMLTEYFALQF